MKYYWEEPPKPRQAPNLYSPDVLTGNWFERRLDEIIDKKAIVPSITGTSDCVAHKSTYQSDFLGEKPAKCATIELRGDATRLAIRGKSGTVVLNGDGDIFMNNFTTTNDVSYRIIPKLMKTPHHCELTEPEEKIDFYGNYGNATKTGLLAWLKCENKKLLRPDMSTMKTDYVPLPIKPIVIVKGKK